MREIQLRLGWEHVAPLEIAQFLIRPERVLKGKLPPAAVTAAGLGLRAATALRDALRSRSTLTVEEIPDFAADHDRLWQEMAATVVCTVKRDASYLNWKYVRQPGQNFVRLQLRDGDRVRAVAILGLRQPDEAYKYRRAFLVDVVAPLTDSELLNDVARAAIDAAARAGADALSCMHISAPLSAALKNAGFRMRTPERHLLVRPADLDDASRRAVLSARSWFVTQGDSDIDRPW
jgi:hypothetical protein